MSILNHIYYPTLIYGSELWTLDRQEMKFLRRSIGKDTIINTRIMEEVKSENVEMEILIIFLIAQRRPLCFFISIIFFPHAHRFNSRSKNCKFFFHRLIYE